VVADVGAPIPEFSLTDEQGNRVTSADLSDTKTILFFYPKAMTPGCTVEACGFRDRYDRFGAAGFSIIGASPDPEAANAAFREKEGLPFPLLSDTDHSLAEALGAWGTKKNYGKEYEGLIRSTFVVEEGTITHAWRNVRAKGHVDRVARELGVD
jgi:peroxiredoxin Q/BCP